MNNRETWFGLLAAILLAVPVALPFAGPGLPLTDDGLFHIANIIDLRQALAGGEVFPRWLEPQTGGLGFPLFNFYPSLAHYLGASFALLGLGGTGAFKLVSALVPLLAAATMYGWANAAILHAGGNRRTRLFAAMGAATAYAYAPYLLVDVYRRGSLAESLALALLPLLFFAVDQVRRHPSLNSALLIAPVLGALVLAHNVTAVLGFGLAVCFIAFSCLVDRLVVLQPGSSFKSIRGIVLFFSLGVGLGLTLSAFFWAPAIMERSYLDFEKLSTGFFSAANHMADGWPPVQASLAFDFKDPFRAGLVQTLVLTLGLIPLGAIASRGSIRAKLDELRLLSVFFALSTSTVLFLLSPFAIWAWREVPLLKDMQFPWRTLGVLAFSGSTLVAVGLMWLGSRWPRFFPFVATALLVGYAVATLIALPVAFPPGPEENLGAVSDAAALAGWEMRSIQPPHLLSFEEVGALVSLDKMERQSGRIEFDVEVLQTATVALHALYFPGWKALVDGRETPTFPVSERGLLGISVPSGRHVVNVHFERTPLRAAAEAVSALSALSLGVLLVISVVRRRPAVSAMLAVAVLASIYILPRLATHPVPPPDFQSVATPASGGIRLLGIGREQPQGGRQSLTLYWQALQPLGELEGFVALVDEHGNTVGEPSHDLLDGAYPTSRWQVGEIIPDRVDLDQLLDLGASAIQLNAGFRPSGPPDEVAPIAAFRLPLSRGSATIARPPSLATLGEFAALESYASSSRVVSPGDDVNANLAWKALDAIPGGVGAYLHLVDAQGRMWAQADSPLGPKAYPAVLWGVGERVREERRLTVPAEAPPGRYDVRLGAYYYPDLRNVPISAGGEIFVETSISLGAIFVVAPQTRPSEVQPKRPIGAIFGGQVELLGFDLGDEELRPGQDLALTTYWRSPRIAEVDYTLFVQLIDSSGAVRGQSDGQIAGDSYPTSLWLPGEFVVDKRTIKVDKALASGSYRVIIGLYHWPELTRLPATVDGVVVGDAVELARLRVVAP